jgi:hypothetical protein
MLATQAPYSQYFDKNGDPLDAGFVYFGSPNQNPETAPITVYWDIDGTQPVAQPARTLAGYIVRNGTPARVYAEGAYSVTVRNRKGEMVYYAPTSTDFSDLPVNRAVVTATNGQTLVNLPFAYTRGNNSLQLFVNGLIVRGNGVDYTACFCAKSKTASLQTASRTRLALSPRQHPRHAKRPQLSKAAR